MFLCSQDLDSRIQTIFEEILWTKLEQALITVRQASWKVSHVGNHIKPQKHAVVILVPSSTSMFSQFADSVDTDGEGSEADRYNHIMSEEVEHNLLDSEPRQNL